MKHIKSHIYKIISFVLIAVVLACSSLSNSMTAYAIAPPIVDDEVTLEALAAILEYIGIHVGLADSLSNNQKAVAYSLQVIQDNRQAIIDGTFDEAAYLAALHAKEQEIQAYNNKQAASTTYNMLNQVSYNNLGIAGSYGLYNILHNAYEYYSNDGSLTNDLRNMFNGNFADSFVIKFETMAALFGLQVLTNTDIYTNELGEFDTSLLQENSEFNQYDLVTPSGVGVPGFLRENVSAHYYVGDQTQKVNGTGYAQVCDPPGCLMYRNGTHYTWYFYDSNTDTIRAQSNPGIPDFWITWDWTVPLVEYPDDPVTAFNNNDTGVIKNLVGAISADQFLDDVIPVSGALDYYLDSYEDEAPSIADLKTLDGTLTDSIPSVKGTTSAIGTLQDILTRTISDIMNPTDTQGILRRILTATQVLYTPMVATRMAIEDLVEIFPATTALLQDIVDTVPASLASIATLVDTVPAIGNLLLDAVIDLPNTITLPLIGALDGIATDLADIKTAVVDGSPSQPTPTPDDDDNSSPSVQPSTGANLWGFNLLWILLLLIYILLKCLLIFANMLTYTLCIFRIPANTTFINEDMLSAILYLKNLQISPLTISVYDFFFGLIYILMFFALLKLIQNFVKKIRVPG